MMPQYHGGPDATLWDTQKIGAEPDVEVKWFERWLKGEATGADKLPPVNLLTMGTDQWQHPNKWPLPNTYYTPYYLDAGGKLGTAKAAKPTSATVPLRPPSSPCARITPQRTPGN